MTERTGMSSHHSARANTEVWLTPPWLLEALGGSETFDLDPCAALAQPWATAKRHLTIEDDGLAQDWDGKVWCNPPYTNSTLPDWLGKLGDHGNGIALIFARTETAAFHRTVWERADGCLFLEGRLFFHVAEDMEFKRTGKSPIFVRRGDKAPANGGAPSVLCAYGPDNADILAQSGLRGNFVPLKLRCLTYGFKTIGTWLEEVMKVMRDRNEPVTLDWLYRALDGSPKAERNPNWRAKVRQTLQRGRDRGLFDQIGDGAWSAT